ncbi:winged helix-turn-helix domain-containing protein [Citrobacter sp. U14242]|uniref:winged helix-turn-helix domain-containing protein n=1 Tax=Citrobacter sp. U14242 TaxID=3390192 RepID=UPI00397B274A
MYLINQLVEFNPDNKSLVNRQTGRAIQLQLPASLCFLYLITHASDIVSQNTLIKVGWGERNNVTTTNTLYQAILTLRNALADVGLPRDTVKTISRRGLTLNENTQIEAITLSHDDVSLSASIPGHDAPEVILPPAQTTQFAWWNLLFTASAVIAILIIWLVWYQTRPAMPFNNFVSISMQIPSRQNCKIYYSPNEQDHEGYFSLMQLHPELCEKNKQVFLTGYRKAERVVAFVCDKDARVDARAFCTTHYYWMRETRNEKNT